MVSRRLLPYSIIALIGAAGVSACSSDECYDNRNSLPLAGFYSSAIVPEHIAIDSLTIFAIGAPGDSLLHDSVSGLAQTYLPFRINGSSARVSYVFRYLQAGISRFGIADTITFSYDIEPRFVSLGCGAVYDYRITGIQTTTFFIDSVTCPAGVITNEDIENIKIYFRVNEDV